MAEREHMSFKHAPGSPEAQPCYCGGKWTDPRVEHGAHRCTITHATWFEPEEPTP